MIGLCRDKTEFIQFAVRIPVLPALREGNHEAKTAITKTVALTSRKSASRSFTGK
jgi:hypothetical protein